MSSEEYAEVLLGPLNERLDIDILHVGSIRSSSFQFLSFRDLKSYILGHEPEQLYSLLMEGVDAAVKRYPSRTTPQTHAALRSMLSRARSCLRHVNEVWELQDARLRKPDAERELTRTSNTPSFGPRLRQPYPEYIIEAYRRLLKMQISDPAVREAAALLRTVKVFVDLVHGELRENVLPSLAS